MCTPLMLSHLKYPLHLLAHVREPAKVCEARVVEATVAYARGPNSGRALSAGYLSVRPCCSCCSFHAIRSWQVLGRPNAEGGHDAGLADHPSLVLGHDVDILIASLLWSLRLLCAGW